MFYSFIIPLYNRPDEIEELLESLCEQSYTDFEVVVIEDGSSIKAEEIVQSFSDRLDVKYFYKENGGQGFARNYGFEKASGDYFIILDSDCIIPPQYLQVVDDALKAKPLDAYGGPDAAHDSFTPVQKAISYAMTSLFTTGGIRGKKQHIGVYHPRSFNMGISRAVYEKTKGFKITRLGEDIEFSVRIIESGFSVGLIQDAFVYHKRRTDFKRFFNQLRFFGKSRINIYTFFPKELKLVHFFPACFLIAFVMAVLMAVLGLVLWLPLLWGGLGVFTIYAVLIWADATIQNKSLYVGFLSVIASFIQLLAYGVGFLTDFWHKVILKKHIEVNEYPS